MLTTLFGWVVWLAALGVSAAGPGLAAELGETLQAPSPASALGRAERLLEEGDDPAQARPLLVEALEVAADHHRAYGRLVQLAIDARDDAALGRLFASHRAFPYERPDQFRERVSHYQMGVLRRISNQAIQAAMNRRWTDAEQGWSQLLGDEAFHHHAVSWLFRIAMKQRDVERARFVAELARYAVADPATSADLLAACSAQRLGERQPAFGYLIRELSRRGGYADLPEVRVPAQRAVYLAMIRLHNELDQCFLSGMTRVSEARPLFLDLPDEVLAYLARRAPKNNP